MLGNTDRQQFQLARELGQDGRKMRVDQLHLRELAGDKAPAEELCRREAVTDGDLARDGIAVGQDLRAVLAEEVQRLLADGQNGGLARLHFAPCKLEHIGVVAAGKTAVAGNDDEERLALFFVRYGETKSIVESAMSFIVA